MKPVQTLRIILREAHKKGIEIRTIDVHDNVIELNKCVRIKTYKDNSFHVHTKEESFGLFSDTTKRMLDRVLRELEYFNKEEL